eukprot:2026980-Pyramimonas_sp.AAC.1
MRSRAACASSSPRVDSLAAWPNVFKFLEQSRASAAGRSIAAADPPSGSEGSFAGLSTLLERAAAVSRADIDAASLCSKLQEAGVSN